MFGVDTIAAVSEFLRNDFDEKVRSKACFIAFQKTFDTLDHILL